MTNSNISINKNHPENSPKRKYWVVIPAAGSGSRMNANTAKQYIQLNGIPVLTHTISQFIHHPLVAGVMVVTADRDSHWEAIKESFQQPDKSTKQTAKLASCIGGETRMDSVLSGLKALQDEVQDQQWILVHDAARPGISQPDLEGLFSKLNTEGKSDAKSDGYILAQKSVDTIKLVSDGDVIESSLDRNTVWAAQTPQVFRYQQLYQTLQDIKQGDKNCQQITDESSAMEQAGFNVVVVEAGDGNFKITVAEDIPRMEFEISYQLQQGTRVNPEKYFHGVNKVTEKTQ